MAIGVKPPAWFWIVALLLLAWNAMGVFACIQQFRLGAEAMGPATDYDRALYASMPVWYNYVYAVATFGGLLGAVALLLRMRRSVTLFWLSLIAVVVMFGYLFATTDLIAHKGAGVVLPFPAVIALIALFSVWFAGMAARKGWIGAG
ncbi:MAG: hypothetical protein J0J06_03125 [Sphingomonas sp.]|uniref:hypothetical protein n=1 Tax=Sphingomonas sp. TaxID=28214 RepID=UPI001AC8E6FE|nr:hypothetical protein [Sphingomonas sp.]MBN8814423.1 hypothetical protein [Sphingomonas sp.]